MLPRRHFVRDTASAMAGMVVMGRGLGGATTAGVQPATTGERREVVIGGRRVRTIDVHSHCEIFEGTLDRYPGLKLCAAHGGGYLPSCASRSDYGCGTRPELCTAPLDKRPTEYLMQLYFDSLVFTSEALQHRSTFRCREHRQS